MNVWEFYQWLQKQMQEQNIAEEAELWVDDDILLRLHKPVIDSDGDVSFTLALGGFDFDE